MLFLLKINVPCFNLNTFLLLLVNLVSFYNDSSKSQTKLLILSVIAITVCYLCTVQTHGSTSSIVTDKTTGERRSCSACKHDMPEHANRLQGQTVLRTKVGLIKLKKSP